MNKKLDNVSPTNPGDFAEAVCALYKHSTKRESEPFRGNVSIEVRRAAFGLALIRNLLDACARSISLSADIPASGIREAYAILDHLTAGRKHPISEAYRRYSFREVSATACPGECNRKRGTKDRCWRRPGLHDCRMCLGERGFAQDDCRRSGARMQLYRRSDQRLEQEIFARK